MIELKTKEDVVRWLSLRAARILKKAETTIDPDKREVAVGYIAALEQIIDDLNAGVDP